MIPDAPPPPPTYDLSCLIFLSRLAKMYAGQVGGGEQLVHIFSQLRKFLVGEAGEVKDLVDTSIEAAGCLARFSMVP